MKRVKVCLWPEQRLVGQSGLSGLQLRLDSHMFQSGKTRLKGATLSSKASHTDLYKDSQQTTSWSDL